MLEAKITLPHFCLFCDERAEVTDMPSRDRLLSTVVDFERERRSISAAATTALRSSLESAGIEFIEENGGGPGLRLRKPQRATKRRLG